MFMVIFEVQPHKERFDDYLEIAKSLKPHIEKIDGFIDNERYSSKRREGRVLSLSTWRDEKAVIRWRTLAVHHQAQEKGRFEIFEDYQLRVGEVVGQTLIQLCAEAVAQRWSIRGRSNTVPDRLDERKSFLEAHLIDPEFFKGRDRRRPVAPDRGREDVADAVAS